MKKPAILWTNVLVFLITGLVALIAVPYYAFTVGFDTFEIVATILCLGYCGMSITAGYHRLWAHKTYKAHPIIEFIFAIGGAFALQNSALHWSSDHRIHHRHVDDNDKDPYSAKMGFWYSHIGWMLREYQASRYHDYSNVRDLQKNKIVAWQHKYYLLLTITTNFGIPIVLGYLNGNILGMLLSAGFLRLVLSHHFTFFINSLAHIWGNQPYTDQNTAKDNGFLALVTYGEGYHNFHHIFEYDYRNGIKWWHFDPTKWFIKGASLVGLTNSLKITPEDRIEKAKADMLLKVSKQKLSMLPNSAAMIESLQKEYEALMVNFNAYYDTHKKVLDLKRKQMWKKYENNELIKQYQTVRNNWQVQKQSWLAFNAKFA